MPQQHSFLLQQNFPQGQDQKPTELLTELLQPQHEHEQQEEQQQAHAEPPVSLPGESSFPINAPLLQPSHWEPDDCC